MMVRALLGEGLVRSWWVWLFGLLCLGVVESLGSLQAAQQVRLEEEILDTRQALAMEQLRSEQLALEIASANDPAWIEKGARMRLGVAAKGEVKVYFIPR